MVRSSTDRPERRLPRRGPAGENVAVMRPPAPQRPGAQPGEKVLITGIAGGQGRLIAHRLEGTFALAGVDRMPWEDHPPEIPVHVLDLRKRKMEDIFRTERPDAVVHLAFIRHFRAEPRVRHEVNVLGTKRLLEYCVAYGVKRVVVLSSSYVYGALARQPVLRRRGLPAERQPHLSRGARPGRGRHAVHRVPLAPSRGRHHHPPPGRTRSATSVHSTMARYLRQRYVPMIMGFDPMTAVHPRGGRGRGGRRSRSSAGTHGVYNVVGPGAVPLSRRDPRDRRHRAAAPRAARATGRSASSSSSGSTTRRPARSTSSSTRARSTAVASSRATGFAPQHSRSRTSSPVSVAERHARDAPPGSTRGARRSAVSEPLGELEERDRRAPAAASRPQLNAYGYDAFGLQPRHARSAPSLLTALLYRYWFRVETHGIERLPQGRMLLIANHAGQVAIDAAMIGTAHDPRGRAAAHHPRHGRVLAADGALGRTSPWCAPGRSSGTREELRRPAARTSECVIAFPEGVRGMNKLIWERYQLQEFGHGLHAPRARDATRRSCRSRSSAPRSRRRRSPTCAALGRLLGMPAFPMTLTWPWLGRSAAAAAGQVPHPLRRADALRRATRTTRTR